MDCIVDFWNWIVDGPETDPMYYIKGWIIFFFVFLAICVLADIERRIP